MCVCIPTWWLADRRPLSLLQVTAGGGLPGTKQLRSRLCPSWTSAMEGWMVMADEMVSLPIATQQQTQDTDIYKSYITVNTQQYSSGVGWPGSCSVGRKRFETEWISTIWTCPLQYSSFYILLHSILKCVPYWQRSKCDLSPLLTVTSMRASEDPMELVPTHK